MSDSKPDPQPAQNASPQSPAARAETPAFWRRRKKRSNEIGQILIRRKAIAPEHLREALRLQEEQGGQIGAILVRLGACRPRAIADALLEQVRLTHRSGTAASIAEKARENPSVVGLAVACRPRLTTALIIASDVVALAIADILARILLHQSLASPAPYLTLPLCLATLWMNHLYGSPPPSPPDELRRIFWAISLAQLAVIITGRLVPTSTVLAWNAAPQVVTWAAAVFLVPVGRAFLRMRFARRPWWGKPVVVLGAGKTARAVVRMLRARPQLGLKPVAILDDDPSKLGTLRATWNQDDIAVESVRRIEVRPPQEPESVQSIREMDTPSVRDVWGQFSEVEGVPVVGKLDLAPILAHRLHIRSAIIIMPNLRSTELISLVERLGDTFNSILVIPDLFQLAYSGAPARDVGGTLGLELQRQLLLPGPRAAKRAMDLVLGIIAALIIVPICLILGILVRLDSPGPALYRQKRLGQDGMRFAAYKFRTMYGDGEKRLQAVLASDPKLQAEYAQFHKLTVDPRVTRVGKVLRKYSLDELPQIWNVLRGEMSLVGPRPYLEREIPEMNQQEWIILRVKPGITGMWQVTDRNATDFAERVRVDIEYVRNWSPWLDVYILARTVGVVLRGTGV